MSINAPLPGDPRRPHGPRDPGDAWVEGDHGRFWGRFGAAGALVHDAGRGILLQHRVEWSDQGGTWALPGGALHAGEDAVTGALREAHEEAAVPAGHLRVLFTSVFDVGYWSYTTVAAEVLTPFEPAITDPESLELAWVPLDEVEFKPLHSGFAAAWPELRERLASREFLVVDAANVVGSRPDGWWRDRRAAAQRLVDGLVQLARTGLPRRAGRSWPRIVVVTEGQARGAEDPTGLVRTVAAHGDGDYAVVETVRELTAGGGASIEVVTADRGLRQRIEKLGARAAAPGWLLDHVDSAHT
ncbi:NUDIX domain-containing protein [Paenarthrobacter sp. DKR-5]|uniref:NUDIX domain-containing protein n=1 Tax=Paenarthrobacter sp. DKR-5 TaxID=2835535 RepID=UPI001BDCE4DC|nr:NUDIX domain-containing protein [Paenarthrobacter sp. DKR-5]MBT1001694.1 NUDIX domain-containing protein [Paenarthrobacter sp. DKR-5]